MNAREFVKALKLVAGQGGATAIIETLKRPPGRKPTPSLVKRSEWFNTLSPEDRANVESIAKFAMDHAVYSTLSVLDGLPAIEPVGTKGRLLLFYEKDEERLLMNDPEAEELTVLFKETTG